MEKVIGRKEEQNMLERAYKSTKAELIAVYGRRRIGKTFLVEIFFTKKKCIFVHITGLENGTLAEQLANFTKVVEDTFYNGQIKLKVPESWRDGFELLLNIMNIMKHRVEKAKIIIFFDELPWLATKRSRFLQNLDYYWNRYWARMPNMKIVVCGSAASWMIDNLIHGKGGLHNRVTMRIPLAPFTLCETKQYLKANRMLYSDKQILMLYMIMGGIPFYFNMLNRSLSAINNINKLCFCKKGILIDEFKELYSSLFSDHEAYEELIKLIARSRKGIERIKLLSKAKLSSDGGTFNKRIEALEASDFIVSLKPYQFKKRGTYYRIIDEYSLFYLSWIEPKLRSIRKLEKSKGYWEAVTQTASWKSWAGYAFEALCYKHLDKIRNALGVAVTAEAGSWQYILEKGAKGDGAQIDLLFDCQDDSIVICEIKFTDKPFVIDKQYAKNLQNKLNVFRKITGTKKQLLVAIISANGIKPTMYSEELINWVVTLDDLFVES